MRVLALDIGEKRIGVAVGNTDTRIAMPVKVMPAHEVLENSRTWRYLLEDNEPDLIVSGLPKSMNGQVGKQAQRVRQVAEKIAHTAGLPLEFCDERLSSAERDMRGKVDSVAASLFLQSWLDAHRSE